MKTVEQIKECSRVLISQESQDGGSGIIAMPGWKGSVIFSYGGGWEHVSVSPESLRVVPSWDDMCLIKSIFWNEDEDVIQVHPRSTEYVNNVPNCLHLWRCTYKEMVLPPSCFVGLKKGQTRSQMMEEVKQAYAIAGEEFI